MSGSEEETPQPFFDDSEKDPDLKLRVHDSNGVNPPQLPELFPDENAKTPSRGKRLLTFFRPYWLLDYYDWKSLKIVIRTWVTVWVSCLLVIIPRSSNWLGMASYLMVIFSFILACGSFSIAQSILVGVLIMVFSLYGFVHQVVALGIASRLRGNHPKEYYIQQLVEQGICENNPQTLPQCFQSVMFHGHFLTARTTIVFAVATFVGVATCVCVKLKSPKLMIGGVVAIINMLIPLIYGVMIPYFDPKLIGLIVLKPLGLTLAFFVVASVLIFPKSSSWQYFEGYISALGIFQKMVQSHFYILQHDRPSEREHGFDRHRKLRSAAAQLKAQFMASAQDESALDIEVTYGRLDHHTALRFSKLMKEMLYKLQGIEVFFDYIDGCRAVIMGEKRAVAVGKFENNQRHELTELISVDSMEELDHIMDEVWRTSRPTFERSRDAFQAIMDWISAANEFRTYSVFAKSKHQKRQQECAQRIVEAKQTLDETIANLEKDGELHHGIDKHGQMQACFVRFLIREIAQCAERILQLLLAVDQQRPNPCLLLPWTKPLDLPPAVEDDSQSPPAEGTQVRDPEARPPTNFGQKLGLKFYHLQKTVFSDKMLNCAVRCAIFTVVSIIPIYSPSTAWWYYSNRLVWVPIMVAMSASGYLGDNVYVTLVNLVYTFIGCLVGLVGWYVGNGRGKGNYYGMAAVCGVISIFLIFYRHFSQHFRPMPPIYVCVTFALVMGTSWVDTQVPQLSNIGYGWDVAWKRYVSVSAGLAIGFIAMIVPKPFTIKKVVRSNLGTIMKSIGQLHADVGAYALHGAFNNQQIVSINMFLMDTMSKSQTVRFEPPLQGAWPKDLYYLILKMQWDVVLLYEYMHGVFKHSDPSNHEEMLRLYGWMDTQLNADLLSSMHMCGASLVMRSPLPLLTPTRLSKRHLENCPVDTNTLSVDTLAGYAIMQHIYFRLDAMMLISKQLVGEEYNFDDAFYKSV